MYSSTHTSVITWWYGVEMGARRTEVGRWWCQLLYKFSAYLAKYVPINNKSVRNIEFQIRPFACNTACILFAVDSYQVWIVSSGILWYCSWTSFSCLRDDSGGNLLLTLLKLTTVVRWYFSLVIVLARENVEVRLHAPRTKTEHLWLCVWVNGHLEKLHHW